MTQLSVSIGCVTLAFGRELLHVSVNCAQLSEATQKPSLHERGLRADHLTIPLKPLSRGLRAGEYWVHLTYPDGIHKDVAWLRPDDLRPVGEAMEIAFKDAVLRQLRTRAVEISAKWLAERSYKLVFMFDGDFPAWADTHFKRNRRHYRVSLERMHKSVGDMCISDPEILDDEDFIKNHPNVIQTLSMIDNEKRFFVWRFPWGPDGSFRWYAAPADALVPVHDAHFLESVVRCLQPGFWGAIRTIMIELGIPINYERLDYYFDELRAGRVDLFVDLHRKQLAAA